MPVLKADGLVKAYKRRVVVNGVSVEIHPGEIVGLLGPNGAGKTTSFYMLVGLIRPDSGRVLLDDKDITRFPMHQRAHQGIGYLAQETSVFKKLTAAENIMLILEMLPGLSSADRKDRLEDLLKRLSLGPRRDTPAQVLSGGEQRRVEIARVLAMRPNFILLDEPFTGVDPIIIEDLQRIIAELRDEKIGVLISDHNVNATLDITDRAYIMSDGDIKTSGSAEELARDPIARKYYLGDSTAGYIQSAVRRRAAREKSESEEQEREAS